MTTRYFITGMYNCWKKFGRP